MNKFICILACLFASSANAALINYNWTWTGSSSTGNYAIGTMSYDDSLAGTGTITAVDIAEFTIEGFTGATSMFTWDLSTGTQSNPFQLAFDTTLGSLVFGGTYPSDSDSVVWGDDSVAALICGSGACGFTGSGLNFDGISVGNKDQFEFTLADSVSVPEPSVLTLLGMGLAGIGFSRKKKSA